MARKTRTGSLALMARLGLAVALMPQMASAQGIFDWFRNDPPAQYRPQPEPQAPRPRRHSQRPTREEPVDGQRQALRPRAGGLKSAQAALSEFRTQSRDGLPIVITRAQWTDADEKQFGAFVARIGQAVATRKCNTVKKCLRSPEANMYAKDDPADLVMYSDCADFPYFLRAYFAYHNGLPFGFVTGVDKSARPYASAANQDAILTEKNSQNAPYGNVIETRGGSNVPRRPGAEINLITYLERMFDSVSTATYRVGALTPGFEKSDLYPVKIDRHGIGPGTVVHSTGHALIVWNVDPDGIINVMDAHPDGSVQFKVIQPSTLDRSRPDQGLGFYRFRPITLVGAQQDGRGYYYGGRIALESDDRLFADGKWSVEQWFGPGAQVAPGSQVDPKTWLTGYRSTNFFDFLASKMRGADVEVKADEFVAKMMQSLCDQFQQRVDDVKTAVAAGTSRMPRPSALPADVFGEADPTWGKYSTPGRDSRLRGSVGDILKSAVSQFRLAKSGDRSMKFEGSARDYVDSLRARFAKIDKACAIKYANSVGQTVSMSLSQALGRLTKMSFDPYDCPEKMWGASGAELATCRDQDPSGVWYSAERYMRNVSGKLTPSGNSTIRSQQPITLSMLRDASLIDQPESSPTNLGAGQDPITNLDGNLASPKFLRLLGE